MSPQEWQEIREIAADTLDLPAEQRTAAVEARCASDPELRRKVDAFLAALEAVPEAFLEGDIAASSEAGVVMNGRYLIVSELAKTSANTVYLARDAQLLNKLVVLKTSQLSGGLMREFQALAELRHPGIVTILDVGDCAELGKFIVLEYVAGVTLRQKLKAGALPLDLARRLIDEIASALTAAHKAGVLHRDLKPENVMLANDSGTERVKLIDFGTARVQNPVAGATTTVAGGTLGYLAPEQLIGNASPASDLYSLAVVAYEMVTGTHPYVAEANTNGKLVHPSELCHELPKSAGDVLLAALRYQPEDRPANVATFAASFEAACQGKRPTRFSWLAIIAAASFAAFAVWLYRKPVAPQPHKVSQIKRLTPPGVLALEPAVSRDVKWIAYVSDQAGDGLLNVWIRKTSTGETRQLTHDLVGARDPDFSRDGSLIAYHSDYDGALYTASIVDGRSRQIAARGRRPRFSPDGTAIAYWDGDPGEAEGIVYVIDTAGGAPTTMNICRSASTDPVWSDDGSRLLMWCYESGAGASEQMDLWVAPFERGPSVKTGVSARLREQGLQGLPPSGGFEPLSWAGDRVLFAARDSSGVGLWEIAVSSKTGKVMGSAQRVEGQMGGTRQAGRAGQKLLFSALDENRHLWALPLNMPSGLEAKPRRVTSAARLDGGPSISADGKRIVFSGDDMAGRRSVWTKDLVSGLESKLSGDLDAKLWPRLARDGSSVVFSTEEDGKRTVWLTSADANGRPAKRLCDACGLPQDWWLDSSEVISAAGYDVEPSNGLFLLSIKTGAKRYIQTPYYIEPRLSPDGGWLSFLTLNQMRWTIFIAPFRRSGEQESEDSWIQITKDNARNNLAAWSPDGRTLYYLSDRDGFRCIWAQRLDPDTKKPLGDAYAVYHSHNARLSLANAGHERATGLSVAGDKIVFSQGERQGAIWTAVFQ